MQISKDLHQFLDTEALIIVAAQEEGIIYRIKNGEINKIELLEQHLEPLSDNEGFFFGGVGKSGGAPKERNDEAEYLKQLRRRIAHELDHLIKTEDARVLYVFEPEHLKSRIIDELQTHNNLSVHTVRYGNYVQATPLELVTFIDEYIKAHKVDLDDHDYDKDFKKF